MDIIKENIAGGVIGTVLDMSLTGTVIILIIAVLRVFMKKLPRRYSCLLWIIPAVRLVCPVGISSQVSLFNVVDIPKQSYVREAEPTVYEEKTVYELPEEIVTLPQAEESQQVQIKEELYTAVPEVKKEVPIENILTAVWLAGMAVMLGYVAFSYGRTWERIRGARLLRDNVYECGRIDSPFVYGLAKPGIYLPCGVSEEDMTHILAHENAHISRGDHISKLIATIILAVHWFNPAVWLGFRLMTEDMELSCDEKALGSYDIDVRKAYAQSLLNMSMKQNGIKLGGMLSFGESSIKARIKGVLAMKKPKTIACVCAAAVMIIAAVCLLTNAAEPSRKMKGYNSFRLVSATAERQAVPYEDEIAEFIKAVDGIKAKKADFIPEGESGVYIKMYESEDALGEYSALEFYETEQGHFMTFAANAGTTMVFPFTSEEYESEFVSYKISDEDYYAVLDRFNQIRHSVFTGIITETAGDTCVVEAEDGQFVTGRFFVSLDEPANIGDRVRVCFSGGVMETSPQQIDQVYASVISAGKLNDGVYYSSDFSKDAHFVVSGNRMQFIGSRSAFEKMYDMMMPDSDEEMRNEWVEGSMNGWKEPVEFYVGNVNTGYGFETEIIFDEVRDGAGNIAGAVSIPFIDEDTIMYVGFKFFRNGTSAWYDLDRLNSDRPDSFKMTETEEGFEAHSEETDIYVFYTPDDGDELILRRNGEERRIPFIGGFFPDYTYCYVSDITGDGVNDLAFFRQWTGTGVADNEAAVIDGSSMTEIGIDRVAAEVMISERAKGFAEKIEFSSTFPMISTTPVEIDNEYRYPLYPDKSIVRYGGMMYGLENGAVTGESLFCFMSDENKYSDIFTALFTFKYENGMLVPDEMSLKAEIENDNEFKAVVTETDEDSGAYIVKPLEDEKELDSSDKIYIDTNLKLKRGQVIRVEYDGRIMETYPARVEEKTVEQVQLKDPYEAAKMYLYAVGIKCESTTVSQISNTIAWQYGENCIEAFAVTDQGQKVVIIDREDMTVIRVLDYSPGSLTGTVKEVLEADGSRQFYTVSFRDGDAEVYSTAMYGSYEDGTAEPFKVGDLVKVEFNGYLWYKGTDGFVWRKDSEEEEANDRLTNLVFNMGKARREGEMTRYALEQWLFHRNDMGYDIGDDKVQVMISLPSDWSGDANGFDYSGGKIMDTIIVYPASEGIDPDGYKIDYALGREIIVHEEKYDGENYAYYIKTSSPDFSSEDGSYDSVTYIAESNGFYVRLNIISDRGIEQAVIDSILDSVEVSALNGVSVPTETIEVTAEDFEQVTMSAVYHKESMLVEVSVENNAPYDIKLTMYNYISRLDDGEYIPVGMQTQIPEPVETETVPSGEGITFTVSMAAASDFKEGEHCIEEEICFAGAEDIVYHLKCNFIAD